MKKYLFAIWLIPLTILLFIFHLSTQDAPTSTEVSKQVTETIHIIVTKKLPQSTSIPLLTNSQLRDLAHITFFFLFGLSCMFAFTLFHYPLSLSSLFTFLFGGISAFLDECIQLTSPGRAFEWIDIGKDMLGITLSILLAYSLLFLLKGLGRLCHKIHSRSAK